MLSSDVRKQAHPDVKQALPLMLLTAHARELAAFSAHVKSTRRLFRPPASVGAHLCAQVRATSERSIVTSDETTHVMSSWRAHDMGGGVAALLFRCSDRVTRRRQHAMCLSHEDDRATLLNASHMTQSAECSFTPSSLSLSLSLSLSHSVRFG